MKWIKFKDKIITNNLPAFIIAEMAWSHDGSVENTKKIIDAAYDAKADAIKFHITSLKDYMVPYYGSGKGRVSTSKEDRRIYDYLPSISLSRQGWEPLTWEKVL